MAIKPVTRNPNWTREELVLGTEFYRHHAPRIPGKTSAALIHLSNEILAAAAMQGLVGVETFRNPNGVYMKLMEIRKYDPAYSGVGLGHGKSRDIETEVWDLRPDQLEGEAIHIRAQIAKFLAEGGSPEEARGITVTSQVLRELLESDDPVENILAHTLVHWQEGKRSSGRAASLGYEPREIRHHGAVSVIEKRVLDQSSGFEEVPPEQTYEHIVLSFPDRFSKKAQAVAHKRIEELSIAQPTTDREELAEKVKAIMTRPKMLTTRPAGQKQPATQTVSVTQYLRDPRVVAYVLHRAEGVCEACESPAPFTRVDSSPYLEAHHILPLAEGGPDTVENCAALCPNCHRAMHSAADKAERAAKLAHR